MAVSFPDGVGHVSAAPARSNCSPARTVGGLKRFREVGVEIMATTRVKFTYPPELLHRPVIYQLGKQFNVVTNVRRANIGDTHGCIEMELLGDPEDVQRGLDWAYQQGLDLAPAVTMRLVGALAG